MNGKIALVTGGTRGLGLAISQGFYAAGATVVTCGRTRPERALFDFHQCDVRDPEAVKAMITAIAEEHGGLDIVVNNAGGTPHVEAATSSPRLSEKIVALNLLAPLWVSQAAYPYLCSGGSGAIVNVASVSAVRPSPGSAVYAAAKAGLLALGRSLAHEWGPAVRVNSVLVGYVETETTEATYGNSAQQAAIADTLAARRLGHGDDVADAVMFLASNAAAWITGAALAVDGGGERPRFLDFVQSP